MIISSHVAGLKVPQEHVLEQNMEARLSTNVYVNHTFLPPPFPISGTQSTTPHTGGEPSGST